MSYQGNQTIAYLISSLLGAGIYSFYAIQQYQRGGFASTTISSQWGTAMLVVIGIQIILSIVSAFLVTILQAIREREEKPSLADERDQLIELKANKIAYSVFGIGFLIAMITLAVGLRPLVMFNMLIVSLYTAAILGYIVQLSLYRRGF